MTLSAAARVFEGGLLSTELPGTRAPEGGLGNPPATFICRPFERLTMRTRFAES